MRVLQITTTLEREATGPSHSIPGLCRALSRKGSEVRLASVGDFWSPEREPYSHFAAHHDWGKVPVLNRLWMSSELRARLSGDAAWADIVHGHGLWVMPSVYPARAARRARKPLVVSLHGMLSPVALQISRLRKKAFWAILQGSAVRQAAMLHATSIQEYRDIRQFGLRQAVAIVPHGVEMSSARVATTKPADTRTLLYLGRIHPIKGLQNLLIAWQRLAATHSDWQLKIVGPDAGGHKAALERMVKELRLGSVVFAGPRYGDEKRAEYAGADLCILPSLSENFGNSVAEALALGIPVITTCATPWKQVREHSCGWSVPSDIEGLEGALREALALDRARLFEMGDRGRAWMERDFSWDRIARDFEQAFRWIIGGGSRPGFVMLE